MTENLAVISTERVSVCRVSSDLDLLVRIFVMLMMIGCVHVGTYGQQDEGQGEDERLSSAELDSEKRSSHPFVIGFERFARPGDFDQLESGLLLISELGCSACHATSDRVLQKTLAPDLVDAGHRLNTQWVKDYLMDPHGKRPQTRMPDVLSHLDETSRQEVVESIAAFLMFQQQPVVLPRANGASPVLHEFWNKGDSGNGSKLYHTVGCVACHEPDSSYEVMDQPASALDQLLEQLEPEEIEELGLTQQLRVVPSVPVFRPGQDGDLHQKYTKQSLTLFLMDPHRVRPAGQMPSLRLTSSEAADIAAYLFGSQKGVSAIADRSQNDRQQLSKQIEVGRSHFQRFGCASCHSQSSELADLKLTPLKQLNFKKKQTCLENPSGLMPDYELDQEQRDAISTALGRLQVDSDKSASGLLGSVQVNVRQEMVRLNCVACHERQFESSDSLLGGLGRNRKPYVETTSKIDIGDEGRLPPSLTGVGAKLSSSGLKGVFSSKATKHRSFLTMRMPSYHDGQVADLLKNLPIADDIDSSTEEEVFALAAKIPRSKLESIGRELINTGCVECHVFREEQLPGAVGVDIHGINQRLNASWFRQFLENPGKLKNRTRMPTFFPDGKSNRADLLDGNIDLQIAAIWHYLKKTNPLPEKILETMSRDFELVPGERPEVVRTFMKGVGTHAIAVGFAEQVHFAFDSENIRLHQFWRGRFLDARGTWFERFVPLTTSLGDDQMQSVPGSSFAVVDRQGKIVEERNEIEFQGYRLDEMGVPIFLYQIGDWVIQDRIAPVKVEKGDRFCLSRQWSIESAEQKNGGQPLASREGEGGERQFLQIVLQRGAALTELSPPAYQSETGLVVRVKSLRSGARKLSEVSVSEKLFLGSESNGNQRWGVTLESVPRHSLEVIYEWE